MELKVDLPALAGQNIDQAAFQRVWNRVMPDQAEGQDTQSPSEGEASSDLSPVPACPEEPSCPDCPACPDCPSCPEIPDQPSVPQPPVFCLGEASQGDSQQLEALMTLAKEGAFTGRVLSRRSGPACSKALSTLASDHRMAFRRLSAAYFLITGYRYIPKCSQPALPASLPLALRQQFAWEQQWARQNKLAAQNTADPCLKELYLELSQEGTLHAGCIRSILEQMA